MINIITSELKNLFNAHIDMILAQDGLTVPCILKYGSTNKTFCSNCVYDPILDQSLNKYNGTGPKSFQEGSICPVCGGFGKIDYDSSSSLYMAVIFDSKYWLNWGPKFVTIPNMAAQTLCSIEHLNKINNCTQAILNSSLIDSASNLYTKAGSPTPLGFGSQDYILTNWTQP